MKRVGEKINKEEAYTLLKKGLLKRKKPDRLEVVHLPFYLFKVLVDPGRDKPKHEFVLVDTIAGSFSFLDQKDFELTEGYKSLNPEISIENAEGIVRKEYNYHLLHRNLRTKLQAKISKITFIEPITYPFWVGYYVHSNHYSLEVVDGLNGKKQSGALKKAVVEYLSMEFEKAKRKPLDIARSLDR